MGLKFDKQNIVAWIIVGALQLLALLILIPVAANIHHEYFTAFLGSGWAWLVTYVYAIVETVGLALIPMMHTAFKNRKNRIAFPVSLVCFSVIFSFDVYMNNVVFHNKGVEHNKKAFSDAVVKRVDLSTELLTLKNRFESEQKLFDKDEAKRQAERDNLVKTMRKLDSLSIVYAENGDSRRSAQYDKSAKSKRSELRQSESTSAEGKQRLERLENAYLQERGKQEKQARSDESKSAEESNSVGWFNELCSHYPGVIFLVMAVFISGMTGFVIDKNQLIVYEVAEEKRNVPRKRYATLILDYLADKTFGKNDVGVQKRLELASELKFSGDLGAATKQLYEMELTQADKRFKDVGIIPRQVFATKFRISPQAVHQRIKDYEERINKAVGLDHRNVNGKLSPLPSEVDG